MILAVTRELWGFVDWKLFCHSIELPDRNNERNYSRIPAGKYRCVWHRSPRFGWVYLVTDVQGRSHILTHSANWAGDSRKGYRCDLNGCIALGMRHMTLYALALALPVRSDLVVATSRWSCKRHRGARQLDCFSVSFPGQMVVWPKRLLPNCPRLN